MTITNNIYNNGITVNGPAAITATTNIVNILPTTGLISFTTLPTIHTTILNNGSSTFRNNLAGVATAQTFVGLCWSKELGLFCAVQQTSLVITNTWGIVTSSDGVTWTTRSTANYILGGGIVWSSRLNLFIAMIYGAAPYAISSPDGITWTTRGGGSSSLGWRTGLEYSPELGLFCAVNGASAGSAAAVVTSPDGITWTTQSACTATTYWTSIKWSAELGIFVALKGTNGTNVPAIMTSPNGITWTTRAALTSQQWTALAYSSELTMFCAVSSTTSVCNAMTSVNGSTWTTRIVVNTAFALNSVIWNSQLSIFVAGGYGVGAATFYYANDGITWTSANGPINGSATAVWSNLAYSPSLGIFSTISATASAGNSNVAITWATATSSLSKTLRLGTQAVTDLYVEANTIELGKHASTIKIGQYADTIQIGAQIWNRPIGIDTMVTTTTLTTTTLGVPISKVYSSWGVNFNISASTAAGLNADGKFFAPVAGYYRTCLQGVFVGLAGGIMQLYKIIMLM
jgi:hypothetical protein